jgi:hypothetical protein
MKIDHSKTLLDTTPCAAYFELIITNPKAPYAIATQVHLDSSGGVDLADTIFTTTGDWLSIEYFLASSHFQVKRGKS